jgi:hypothetical protein
MKARAQLIELTLSLSLHKQNKCRGSKTERLNVFVNVLFSDSFS